MESDASYFGRRASEEREAATAATDPRARTAHLGLADRYDELVRGIARHEKNLGLHPVA